MLVASLNNIKKFYGDRKILDIKSFEISDGEKVGLVGVNGAGKSTLIKILIGEIPFDEGRRYLTESYGYISQKEEFIDKSTDSKIKSVLNAPSEYQDYLSGGEKIKLRVVEALKEEKALLIADEPTSNLDEESIKVLENMLKSYKGSILLVSHDRVLLDSLCTKIIEINDGNIKEYKGNYSKYLLLKEEEKNRSEFEYNEYVRTKKRLEGAILEKEEKRDSIKRTPKRMGNSEARLHKMGGQRSKKNLDGNINAIKSRINQLEVKEKPKNDIEIKINIRDGLEVISKNILEAKDLTLKVGDKKLLEEASFNIKKGRKVALIGQNGIGKSTLLKEIVKDDNEAIKINNRVKIGYFDQVQEILNDEKSILENIKKASSYDETFIRINLNLFGFKGDRVYELVKGLSGGEKVKVALCKILLEDNNFLILDEPTNYLDIISMEALENALIGTDKTILIVSHDRRFISKVCDCIIEIESKKIIKIDTGYEGYLKTKNTDKSSKLEKRNKEELLIYENKLSELISLLSIENDEVKKNILEKTYNEVLLKVKELRIK